MSYLLPTALGPQPEAQSLLGTEWNEYLENHGRWGIYIRADRRFPCADFDSNTDTPDEDTNCPECFGIGYKAVPERIKFHVALDVKKSYSSRSGISPAYYGDVETSAGILYTRAASYPQYQDLLFEVEWDVPIEEISDHGTPTRLITGWMVMRPNPVITGEHGAVDLWLSGLQRHHIKSTFFETVLRGAGAHIKPPGIIEGLTSTQTRLFGGNTMRDAQATGSAILAKDRIQGNY